MAFTLPDLPFAKDALGPHMRPAGVPGRGEKGKTCAAMMSQSSSNFRLLRAMPGLGGSAPFNLPPGFDKFTKK